MKFMPSVTATFLTRTSARKNLAALTRFVLFLAATISMYSVVFHVLMMGEGQEHWRLTGPHWTLTVMSTLGGHP